MQIICYKLLRIGSIHRTLWDYLLRIILQYKTNYRTLIFIKLLKEGEGNQDDVKHAIQLRN